MINWPGGSIAAMSEPILRMGAMSDKYLAKIAALLRKAESTDNEHEADAYLQAAQRLATLSSVDLAVARTHITATEKRPTPTQRTVSIGEPGKRGLKTYVQLFLEIGRANNLTCDIAANSSRVFAYGFDTDIDAAEALYASLVVQMVRASDAYIKSGRYAEELVARQVRVEGSGRYRYWAGNMRYDYVEQERPVHPSTARINFQFAFAVRIGKRLAAAKTSAQQQAVAQDQGTGVELVLRAREVELADHYRATSTARGSWRASSARAGYSELSQRAGDKAGRSARLGGEKAIGGEQRRIGA